LGDSARASNKPPPRGRTRTLRFSADKRIFHQLEIQRTRKPRSRLVAIADEKSQSGELPGASENSPRVLSEVNGHGRFPYHRSRNSTPSVGGENRAFRRAFFSIS